VTWINRQYPGAVGKHIITSPVDEAYNCIAWAAEFKKDEWWDHTPGYKWPATRSPLITSLVNVFLSLGWEERTASENILEPEFERVALYRKNDEWTHAARQLPSGKWTSKLGPDEDIEHDTPECLCGDSYGTIHCIMRKVRQ
jgi:hypothetical protein